jgi:hypothetical protein
MLDHMLADSPLHFQSGALRTEEIESPGMRKHALRLDCPDLSSTDHRLDGAGPNAIGHGIGDPQQGDHATRFGNRS